MIRKILNIVFIIGIIICIFIIIKNMEKNNIYNSNNIDPDSGDYIMNTFYDMVQDEIDSQMNQ